MKKAKRLSMMSLVLFFQEFCCSFHGYGLILSDRSSILFDGSSNGVFQKYKNNILSFLSLRLMIADLICFIFSYYLEEYKINGVRVWIKS